MLAGVALVILGFGEKVKQVSLYGQILSDQNKIGQINQKEIWIGQNKIMAEVADSNEERIKGLSGRQFLDEDRGMLFIFEQPGLYTFWMKDMKIPLDFIWVRDDKIVDTTENVQPPAGISAPLPIYRPAEKADKVLEVNAGWVARHRVKAGDVIQILP